MKKTTPTVKIPTELEKKHRYTGLFLNVVKLTVWLACRLGVINISGPWSDALS
jgi:hypothetical protein